MTSFSQNSHIERARPLLGTTVTIRLEGGDEAGAHAAIDAAFNAVARVHALMSFHESDSDISRLHAAGPGQSVLVDEQTAKVLREARRLSALSDGVFDVTIGSRMVNCGLLPMPAAAIQPAPDACWEDIELDDAGNVLLRRAAWIDLGGIAKGYAVDCAIETLRAHGMSRGSVNAGGDLRTLGDGPHRIAIATDETNPSHVPVLEIGEAAVATSSGRAYAAQGSGPHVNGRRQSDTGLDNVATVVAPHCIHADALTKVVLALGEASAPILRQYEAIAYLQHADGHWTSFGAIP